jgi:hypothetical protein
MSMNQQGAAITVEVFWEAIKKAWEDVDNCEVFNKFIARDPNGPPSPDAVDALSQQFPAFVKALETNLATWTPTHLHAWGSRLTFLLNELRLLHPTLINNLARKNRDRKLTELELVDEKVLTALGVPIDSDHPTWQNALAFLVACGQHFTWAFKTSPGQHRFDAPSGEALIGIITRVKAAGHNSSSAPSTAETPLVTPVKAIEEKEELHEELHEPTEAEVKAEPEEEDGGW